MKAKSLWLVGIAVLVAVSGCATITAKNLKFDETLPESQACTLELQDNVSISLFDGNPVKWEASFFGSRTNFSNFPVGHHRFVLNWTTTRCWGAGGVGGVDIIPHHEEFEQDLEAGHTYRVTHFVLFGIDFGVKIKDVTKK
jgi:hypothetical protein